MNYCAAMRPLATNTFCVPNCIRDWHQSLTFSLRRTKKKSHHLKILFQFKLHEARELERRGGFSPWPRALRCSQLDGGHYDSHIRASGRARPAKPWRCSTALWTLNGISVMKRRAWERHWSRVG